MDCGGKRSATPLLHARRFFTTRWRIALPKAVSPLRFATAVQNLQLTGKPSSLYNIVAMGDDLVIHSTTPQGCGSVVHCSPLLAGLVLPPVVTLVSVLAMLETNMFTQWLDSNTRPPLMGFLLVTGMTLTSSTMIFGSLAARWFGPQMEEFRFALIGSALATLLALTVCGLEIATKVERYYNYEQTLLGSVPILIFCITALRLAVGNMKRIRTRVLTLGGFMAATVWVQSYIVKLGWDFTNDEQVWSLNSLLIGLAFAIALGAWGAKEFRHN